MSTGGKWFGRVVWLGIIFNLCFAIPAIFAPDTVLAGMDLPPAVSMLWLQNVGMLLLTLCVFYTPSAVAPGKFPTHTKLVVSVPLDRGSVLVHPAAAIGAGRSSKAAAVHGPHAGHRPASAAELRLAAGKSRQPARSLNRHRRILRLAQELLAFALRQGRAGHRGDRGSAGGIWIVVLPAARRA